MSILENIALNMNIANNTSGTQKGSGSFANAKNEILKDMALRLLESISDSNTGSTIELTAQVRDILQNQVVLALPDDSVISGRTDTLLPLSIGDNATFTVSMNPDGQVTLSLVSDSSDSTGEKQITTDNPLVKKALTAANIPANPRSLQVTSELLNAGQSVSTANIRKFITLSLKNPELPVKELVLLDANKVPLTQENLTAFKEISQGGTLWDSEPSQPQPMDSPAVASQPIGHQSADSPATNTTEAYAIATPESPIDQSVPEQFLNQPAKEPLAEHTINELPQEQVIKETSANQSVLDQPVSSQSANQGPVSYDATANMQLPANESCAQSAPEQSSPAPIEPREFSEEAVKKFYGALKSNTDKTPTTASKPTLPVEQPVLQGKVTSEAVEKAVQNSVQTASTADKLQFMQDINNVFPFIQIPVKLQEENAKGELYVFERKKKFNPDEPLTAVLHLELDSLGTTDIKVSLFQNKVSAYFEVADSSAVKFFQDELPEFSERLSKLGFTLDSDFKVKNPAAEEKPLLYQFLEAHSPKNYSRYTFDVHA